MPPSWTDPSKATRVILFLDGVLGLNNEGKVTLGFGGEFDASVATLTGLTSLSDELPDSDRHAIVRRSVIEAKKSGDLASDRVLEEIQNRQAEFLRKPKKPYVLLTSLSVRYFEGLASIRPKGATITFTSFPPKRFELPDIAKRTLRDSGYSVPLSYTSVRVHTYARNESAAVEKALNHLDFIRSLWNLALTYGRRRHTIGIGHRPVSLIVTGPIHTLHTPDGSPIADMAWWRSNVSSKVPARNIRSKYEDIKQVEQWGRNRLSESSFGNTLQSLMIRYVHALDEADLQSAFLKLWALLEELTNASGKEVGKRAVMMFKPRDYRSLILDQLRQERNRMVHEGHETERAEILVYELKQYVDALLDYLLNNINEWGNLSDFGLFLSLPQDAEEVTKRSRYHDLAYDLLTSE